MLPFFSLVLMVFSLAFPVYGESLRQALSYAYEHNPSLQSERAKLRATDEGVAQANAGKWRPQVFAHGTFGVGTVQQLPGTTYKQTNAWTAELVATENLYHGGKTTSTLKVALAQVQAARASLLSKEQDVLMEVASSYSDVLSDAMIVRLDHENLALLRQQLAFTRNRLQVGHATTTDVASASANYASGKAALIRDEGALSSSRAAFEKNVGRAPVDLTEPNIQLPLPRTLQEAREFAVQYNPLIAVAQNTYEAARRDIRVRRSDLFPTLDLTASVGREKQPTVDTSFGRASVGLSLNIPLYTGGLVRSYVRQAQERATALKRVEDEVRREVVQGVSRAWSGYMTSRASIRALTSVLKADRLLYKAVKEEEGVGSRTLLEVMNAQQILSKAKVDLANAQRNHLKAQFSLMVALGWMNIRSLRLKVKVYHPRDHYEKVKDKLW